MPNFLAQLTKGERSRFWTRGKAPTFEEFARAWTKAKAEEHRLHLRHQRADGDWKALRTAKAKSALATLARIAPVRVAARSASIT